MATFDDREIHIFNGADPADDTRTHIRAYGELSDCWVVDSYNPKASMFLIDAGAKPQMDGGNGQVTFLLTAKQLVEFIAEQAGLNIEFRKKKRRTLTDEQRARYQAMIAEARKARKEE